MLKKRVLVRPFSKNNNVIWTFATSNLCTNLKKKK